MWCVKFKTIVLIGLLSTISFAETNEPAKADESVIKPLSAREFEQLCDRVTYLLSFYSQGSEDSIKMMSEAADIMRKTLNEQGTNFLLNNYYDSMNGMFIYCETIVMELNERGFHHKYRNEDFLKTNNLKFVRETAHLGRKIGYDTFLDSRNPERFDRFLAFCGNIERGYQSVFESKVDHEKINELFSIAALNIRINFIQNYDLYLESLNEDSVGNPLYDEAPGISYDVSDEKYRKAFKIWVIGLRNSGNFQMMLNFLEYAETSEIIQVAKILKRNTLKFPTIVSNYKQILQERLLMNKAFEIIDFELNLRKIIESADKEKIIEQLKLGLQKYKKILYAEKLADYENIEALIKGIAQYR